MADVPGVVVPATDPEVGPELLDGLDLTGRAVLVRTGWDAHWGTERYGEPGHPFLAVATAERLVAAGAAVVGIDSVNIDDTPGGRAPDPHRPAGRRDPRRRAPVPPRRPR